MASPRLDAAARLDKNTEKKTHRFPFQLDHSIMEFARKRGFTYNQALKELVARGLHTENFNREQYFVEPLEDGN